MMGMLLAFAPFIVFAVLDRALGVVGALGAAALIAAALLVRDLLDPKRTVKVLEIGTVLLFGGLALYAIFTGAEWSLLGVRLLVDAGLLLIVVVSIIIRRPFTLQYAREQVPKEHWDSPHFLHANDVISAAWGAAFALMVLADIVMMRMPSVPLWVGIAVTVGAIVGAISFTQWYSERVSAQAEAAQ